MLAAGTGFVSGTKLATQLGISRVAVWQHMEKLRDQRFVFEAVRSRGYRLTHRPATLNALLIEAHLPSATNCRIICLDTVDSTNDEAMRLVGQGMATPLVVIAQEQTQGRGRLGRTWLSEPNGNLYVTFGLRPAIPPSRLATITPWIGVNLCHLIANYCRISPQIKWPNDLLIDGRKAGGILTEARIDADHIRDLVIGFGLNLTRPRRGWTGDLAHRAIALDEVTRTPIDINHFAAALVGRILAAAQAFQAGEHGEKLAEWWQRYDALLNREVTVLHGRTAIAGRGAGIDPDGALVLKRSNGQHQRFHAGEVTIARR